MGRGNDLCGGAIHGVLQARVHDILLAGTLQAKTIIQPVLYALWRKYGTVTVVVQILNTVRSAVGIRLSTSTSIFYFLGITEVSDGNS